MQQRAVSRKATGVALAGRKTAYKRGELPSGVLLSLQTNSTIIHDRPLFSSCMTPCTVNTLSIL